MSKARAVKVAAVQVISENGTIEFNLAHAEPFVREAASKGAELVLLPEFLPTGYEVNCSIWNAAEPYEGLTVQWLRKLAKKFGIWIGTSFLEAEGNEFFNTFVLADSSGQDCIRVRKSKPAATEAFLFTGAATPRVVETPFGRIGISICYEATLSSTLHALAAEEADLVLMPMSAPTPTLNAPLTQEDLDEYNEAIKMLASSTAKALGVPAVMANKVGPWKTVSPWPFPAEDSRFPGCSAIAAADGTVLSQADDCEGVLVAEVVLDPALKVGSFSLLRGKWARKPPRLFRLFVIAETLGRLSYLLGFRRRRLARRVSGLAGHLDQDAVRP